MVKQLMAAVAFESDLMPEGLEGMPPCEAS